MKKTDNICEMASIASSAFELSNTDLKRRYLINNILLYNLIASKVSYNCGSFGTGYPFYALKSDLTGSLPIIDEQLRYNDELLHSIEEHNCCDWSCEKCLMENYKSLPDLKIKCKPCDKVPDSLKPRKVINRLPDIDLWTVYSGDDIEYVKETLSQLFFKYHLQPSDIDPVNTIEDMYEIADNIEKGIMPSKTLPLDSHIIDFDTLYSLIEQMPDVIDKATSTGDIPYLPIHPLSLRKKWQYDDTPYNFVLDYLYTLTDFNFSGDLKALLQYTRNVIANNYSNEQLFKIVDTAGSEATSRRLKTRTLRQCFNERINSWRD